LSASGKLSAVSPARVHRVSKCDFSWIAGIPTILRQSNFLDRTLASKRRARWTCCRFRRALRFGNLVCALVNFAFIGLILAFAWSSQRELIVCPVGTG
jgi:hypothetical protein